MDINALKDAAEKARAAATDHPDDETLQKAAADAEQALADAQTKVEADAGKKDKQVKARVILAHGKYAVGDVVRLSEAKAEQARLDGWADPHPDAVKFAEQEARQRAGAADGQD